EDIRQMALTVALPDAAEPSPSRFVGAALVYEGESASSLVVAAMIILPQVLTALMSPWVGRRAQTWGRRPLLLIGFGALPIRGLVFALTADPPLLISLQLLDGISGAVIGVLTALVIADLTRGSGHFNLAQGIIGTASGIGTAHHGAPKKPAGRLRGRRRL